VKIIKDFLREHRDSRARKRKEDFWFSNCEAGRIIKNFVSCKMKNDPYAWDDLMSIPHTNPDVVVAVELINEFERRFPARHDREYCAPTAIPYFIAIADLLEQNRFHVESASDIECVDGEYPPKMKEFLKCVEDTVAANATVDDDAGGVQGGSTAKPERCHS
jgi:hypothetical protein